VRAPGPTLGGPPTGTTEEVGIRIWLHRDVAAPAPTAWDCFVDTTMWPSWGPSVRRVATAERRIHGSSRGTVTTAVHVTLPFVVTEWVDGVRWSWRVAGIAATAHRVDVIGADRCRIGIGVPWWAPFYLPVCWVALRRLERLAVTRR
jgi:hypothetical protein